jgi:hypothetical protein
VATYSLRVSPFVEHCGIGHRFFCGLSIPMSNTYRHLPHWSPDETPIFVTWRLFGAAMFQAGIPPAQRDALLDKIEFGPKWLSDPRIAKVVADALCTAPPRIATTSTLGP